MRLATIAISQENLFYSKHIYIFALLVNHTMNQKEILTAPIADAIIPSGVIDKPSACGAFKFMVMLKQSGIYKIQSKCKPERIYIGSA
jgi:hypothetical protein